MIRVAPAAAANPTGAVRVASRGEQRMGVAPVGAAASAFGIAVMLAVRVAVGGPVAAVVETDGGRAVVGFAVDRLAGVVLVLVTGIDLTVQVFSVRYLRGDCRGGAVLRRVGDAGGGDGGRGDGGHADGGSWRADASRATDTDLRNGATPLNGKQILVTGVVTTDSIAFAVARRAHVPPAEFEEVFYGSRTEEGIKG